MATLWKPILNLQLIPTTGPGPRLAFFYRLALSSSTHNSRRCSGTTPRTGSRAGFAPVPHTMSGRVVQQLDCQYGARVSTEVSDRTKANCGAYPELHNLRSEAFSNTKIARSTNQCVSIDDCALSSSIMANDVEHQEKVTHSTYLTCPTLNCFQHLLRTSDSVTLDLEKTARVLSSSKRPSHEIDDGETTHGQKYLKYTKTDDVHGRTHTRVIKLHNASSDPLEPSRVRLQKVRVPNTEL